MSVLPQLPVKTAQLPQAYQSAKATLAKCSRVDECKDWADKAAALASYARQSEDETLEKLARRIRARAIRRSGELLKAYETSKGGRPSKTGRGAPTSSTRTQAARSAGMSKDQQVTAVRVASVGERAFDEAVESDDPPTVTELARRGTRQKEKPAFDLHGRDPEEFILSTSAQGRLRDLAEIVATVPPFVAARGSLDHERSKMLKNAQAVWWWSAELARALEEYMG